MGTKDISILIVEDHEATREGLALLLSDYNCTGAETAEEAIELLAARFFNLVITDIHLPVATGLEVCRLVHKRCPDTVLMVISGTNDLRYEAEALRQGTLYYIEKPIDPDRLLALVASALKSQALGRGSQKPFETFGATAN